jgi:hypothetical protein
MTMAIQQIPFLYSYTGGMTPETLEVFWLREDCIAEYVTANSWPQQPPFDEIGHYRNALPAQDRETLWRFVQRVQEESRPGSLARSLDAGTEFFRAYLDEQIVEATWSPSRSLAQYQSLSRQVRLLIARTRSAPLSTLRTSFVPPKSGDQISLTFQNRGREPFVFYDAQQADEALRIQVRVRTLESEAAGQPSPANPLFLAHLKPLAFSNAPNWRPDEDGKISLNPGTTSRLEIDRQALGSSLLSTLEGLVRVTFFRGAPEGGSVLEQGWTLPVPFKSGAAMEESDPTRRRSMFSGGSARS